MTEAETSWQADDTSVRVALRIRPQSAKEKIDMCRVCTSVTPGEPQVMMGNDKSFTYDYVFDIESTQEVIYNDIARALVDGCFHGYNATIFAYGQTGSGKTYTMGTGFDVEQDDFTVGIIPRAVSHLFNGINERKKAALSVNEPAPDFKVNAQFMELYNEEIIDLLDTTKDPSEKGKYKSHIKIHEDAEGGIYTVGVTTRPVQSLEDTMQCLKMGALSRTTASTNMNTASSRSHAIFTLHIKQQRIVNTEEDDTSSTTSETQTFEFETLTAKFHFVDLAGSERLKRTGAIGERAKEGISINCGLLALGNVISALGDKAKKGSHVPYRDSKLTRLLQDSLGGNSRTLMIACISPSDRDFMETLNTLKYANRARNIKNKVSVNQDKTSRQIAALRQQVQTLMDELADYKQGKRLVDADGVETVNDMFHENTMLQSEIQSLRTRVKALQDTVDCLKQQLTDKELAMVTAITGEGGEEVAKLVEGYVNEIQTLRAKLMETEATLRRSSPRVPSRATMSPMTAPMISNYDLNVSNSTEDAGLSTILSAAKKDVRKLKKERKRLVSHGSDKENETEGQGNVSEEEKQDTEKQEQETEHKAEDESDEEGHVEEVEDGDLSSETDSEDSENIHEDLATITCEISIKETLIEELEKSQRRLHSLKTHYEEKLLSLQARIKETELERDKVLNNIGSMESTSQGDKKKMKDQYEKKLNDMKSELKKLNAAKKEHNKLMRNQSQYEQQLKTLQRDLSEMKKVKVKLMNKMKDEAQKNRQAELKKNKEIAQLRKVQRTKEHTIKTLEAEKRQKEVVLRRKQEEVELLRKRQKPMSAKTAGRVATYKPESSLYGRRKKKEFSPKAAKQKWDSLNKAVSSLVTKKQTLVHMEKDMERWMKDREKKGKRLDKLMQKRERTLLEENNEAQIKDVTDQISTLKASIDFAQDNITECQTNIMQLEEETKEEESFSQLTVDGLEEAKYLLEHFMNLAIGKGMLAAQKDTENRELVAQMEQEKLELMFNRDMLHYLIKDQVDIDIDLPDFGAHRDDEYELQSGASSSSTSPIDSRLENQFQPINASLLLAPPGGGEAPAFSRKDKARRKTATPEDLLYANSGPSEGGPPLLPVVELPGEREMMYDDDDTMSVDSLMMPPPRIPPSLLLKQNGIPRPTTGGSSATSPGPSPALGGRKFPGRTIATVEKKKSQTSTSSTSSTEHMGSRANSIDDQTPPTSPMTTRRIRDENVFSRLTSNSQPSSPSPNRGSINATSKPSITRTSPLTCTHLAEGHTKAILSVYATDDLLFSSSKDRTAKVWDLETGEEVLSLTGHPNNVTAVRYSEASHLIYTVSTYFVKVWDIRDTKRSIKTLSSSGLSSDGTPHETSSRQIDCPPGETMINDIAVNSTGTVAYTAAGNSVRIWDIRSTKAVGRLSGGRQSAVMVIAVDDTDTADGNICVVTGSKDHYIKIFEMSEDTVGILSPKYNLEPPHYDGIQSLCLMGDLLFSGSRDMCIKKWDLSEHELSKSINNAHNNWVTGLTFAPGGDCLLSGCRGGYLKLWNIDTCACLGEIKAHNSPINSIATNRRSVFTASNDNTIGIWQTQGMIDDGGCGD